MKLEGKHLFPTCIFRCKCLYLQLLEGLEMRKILGCGIRMQQNPQTRVEIFWTFMDFHGVMQVQCYAGLAHPPPPPPPTGKFYQWDT